jgi:hypothetical protein
MAYTCVPEHKSFITQNTCIQYTSHDSYDAQGHHARHKHTSYIFYSNLNMELIYIYYNFVI